jgi:hypothetical protein
MWPI